MYRRSFKALSCASKCPICERVHALCDWRAPLQIGCETTASQFRYFPVCQELEQSIKQGRANYFLTLTFKKGNNHLFILIKQSLSSSSERNAVKSPLLCITTAARSDLFTCCCFVCSSIAVVVILLRLAWWELKFITEMREAC